MNIALIAHDAKKELLVQFCIAYCGIISRHDVCATGTTGKLVSEATGLRINCFLSGSQGGGQQIASRIACNEIDLLIFFRDPFHLNRTSQTTTICSGSATFIIFRLQQILQLPKHLYEVLNAVTLNGEKL